jgi:poly-gamma-glutamate synthesis protein (capsule biosynthesis protein)
MLINVAGDFCITPPFLPNDLFSQEVVALFERADLNIVNLECPIISQNELDNKILKTGPHLHSDDGIFNHFKNLNINAVALANNHILDYSDAGLQRTVEKCRENNIITTGVGKNIRDAGMPRFIDKNGLLLAIVNICENEWSIAGSDSPGANPLDLVDNHNQIKLAKSKADKVFVIIHGGHEYYPLPSPQIVKTFRFFADSGADAVIAHHPHCIGGYEVYKSVPIFYSLGTMIITRASVYDAWYTGLVLQIDIDDSLQMKWQLIPIRQSIENHSVSLLNGAHKEDVLSDVEKYSRIIANDEELHDNWVKYIDTKKKQILQKFSPLNGLRNRYLIAIFRRLGFNKIAFSKKYLASVLNYIRCDALHNLSKEVLKSKLYNK